MDIAILRRFTRSTSRHEWMAAPFTFDSHTYATDGHAMIRVPAMDTVPEAIQARGHECRNMINEALARSVIVWQCLPPFELERKPCPECGGTGYVKICPAYGNPDIKCGNGIGSLCSKHNDDCFTGCNPTDKGARKCEECEGDGKIDLPGNIIVDGSMCKVRISTILLDKIKDLPGVKIAPHDSESFFLFRFDGGDGLMMPMRI